MINAMVRLFQQTKTATRTPSQQITWQVYAATLTTMLITGFITYALTPPSHSL